jgi:queuosine precursor transporter
MPINFRSVIYRLFSYKFYRNTIAYVACIILLNTLFAWVPLVQAGNAEFSPMDWACGVMYILRDFAQREIGHKVGWAMLCGGGISYYLAAPAIALASISAFVVAESIDWLIYTFTRRPLSDRLLWSAGFSAPVDSLVFLLVAHRFNWLEMTLVTLAKWIGIVGLWYLWRRRNAS